MPNFLTSLLRTYVPIAVGALVSWLLTLGIELDAETQAGLIVALTGLSQAAYYALVRALEPHMPDWLTRVLIGSAKAPIYLGSLPEVLYATDDRVMLTDGAIVTVAASILDSSANVPSYAVTYASGQRAEVRESDIVRRVSPSE